MAKRTAHEIEKDYKRIRKIVNTTPVTSIKDIALATELSESEVKISLSKHPRVEKEVMSILTKNKEDFKAKKQAEKEALESQKKVERETEKKDEPEVNTKAVEKAETTTDFERGFVIDASITGIKDLSEILLKICSTNAKLILTSVTIKELDKMQTFKDIDGIDARHILAMAAEHPESFISVLIDETLDTPDDCIVNYCVMHKDNVILLTSDKRMALSSRMYGVETQYFKQSNKSTNVNVQSASYKDRNTRTLLVAKRISGKLFITDFNTNYRSIMVISDGLEYTEGTRELKIGDDVYLATKKTEYLTFAHYKITSLYSENNCELIYSKRIYDVSEISNLSKAGYKSFMRNFKVRHDL